VSDDDSKLQRETRELKGEVRYLRRSIQGSLTAIFLVIVTFVPQLLVLTASLGATILFGFLVLPHRRMIFSSSTRNHDSHGLDL
jgi:hypothetical protein